MVISRQFERLFDLRTIRRNIRSGVMTREKYDEYLRSLPDMADNVAPLGGMDEDGEGKPSRGEGGGTSAPSFPRRTDVPILTGDDDDDLDDDDLDDDDDDDDDDDADEKVSAAPAAAPAPVAAQPAAVEAAAAAPAADAAADTGDLANDAGDDPSDAGADADKPE